MATSAEQDFEAGIRFLRDAYMKKTSSQENELISLRAELSRQDGKLEDLRKTNYHLENELQESNKNVQELTRVIAKLTQFKQNVMEGLTADDISNIKSIKKDAIKTSPAKPYDLPLHPSVNRQHSLNKSYYSSSQTEIPNDIYDTSPRPSYKSTATTNPKQNSGYFSGSVGSTPKLNNVPNAVDGRDFFKKARSILPYDKFTALLWNVKSYNSRDHTREQTLSAVRRVLLPENNGLWSEFEELLG